MLGLSRASELCPEVLLWSLMLGTPAAPVGGAHRGWFNTILIVLKRWLRIAVWDKLERLEHFDVVRQTVKSYAVWEKRKYGYGGSKYILDKFLILYFI